MRFICLTACFIAGHLPLRTATQDRTQILAEAADVFLGHLNRPAARASAVAAMAPLWSLSSLATATSLCYARAPAVESSAESGMRIGRVHLRAATPTEGNPPSYKLPLNFVGTRHSLALLEKIAVSVNQQEPVRALLQWLPLALW